MRSSFSNLAEQAFYLYFPKTFWQISFSGNNTATFVGSYMREHFFLLNQKGLETHKSRVICDIFVNFWRNGCISAIPNAYQVRASFFKTTFNFRYVRCFKVLSSIGRSTDQRYFNRVANSTIFSKNFSTNSFSWLFLSRFRWLVYRGIIFRKP